MFERESGKAALLVGLVAAGRARFGVEMPKRQKKKCYAGYTDTT